MCQTSADSFCCAVPSVMPQDEPSGVGPEVQDAIKQAFSNLSANLTTVIESRLSDFSGIWSRSVILRWLPWLNELRGAK